MKAFHVKEILHKILKFINSLAYYLFCTFVRYISFSRKDKAMQALQIKIQLDKFAEQQPTSSDNKSELIVSVSFDTLSTGQYTFGEDAKETVALVQPTISKCDLVDANNNPTLINRDGLIKTIAQAIVDNYVAGYRVSKSPKHVELRVQKAYGSKVNVSIIAHNKHAWPDKRVSNFTTLLLENVKEDISAALEKLFPTKIESEEEESVND